MKKILSSMLLFCFLYNGNAQNVGIGTTTPDASAKLDVTSTTSGFLPPRMTTAQRNAIANPAQGLMIFNTTTQTIDFFTVYGWSTIKLYVKEATKLIGGNGYDIAYSINKTTDGGYIVAGYSNSSANGDVTGTTHGNIDIWIIKVNYKGELEWNKLLGGNSDDIAFDIHQTTDGGYIIAGITYSSANQDVTGTNHGNSDYWIVKLDASGNILWNKVLGGSGSDDAQSIQQTTDGGYIIAGQSQSSASGDVTATSHGGVDYWIVKLDSTGNTQWNKLLGGNSVDMVFNIQQTTDGGYIVAGRSGSSANGDVTPTNHGTNDYWIVKLDGSGNIAWNKLLGGTGSEDNARIIQTTDGGYIISGVTSSSANGDVTGTNHGNYDYWIVKLDNTGTIIWNKLFGGSLGDFAYKILQTNDGGYVVAGYSQSSVSGDVTDTNHGYSDYWIIKLDGSGILEWNKLLGGNWYDEPSGIIQTADGGYIITGYSNSSVSGNVIAVNHGFSDYWIVRLDASGNIL